MPQRWKTVRIFISSTFRDMHAERDHLVRFVFPELKEKCRKNHVHLIDVDLRWGVTEADAKDGKALDICLDEIDSCRPYFLGLLGHRYGWVPSGEQHSITAQEIYHGVLHNEIPKQVVDLRRIINGKLEGKILTQEQINCLVSCYPWDADKGKYLLREDASDDELEIIRAVFMQYSVYQRDRSFFFFRSETLTKKLAGAEVKDFFESNKATQDKLAALKQEIIDEGLPCFEYEDIEAFGEKVGETLWQRIEAELGEPIEEEKDWLEEEAEFHELFVADRTRRFVGRRDVLDRMHGFCEQHDEPSVLIITGEPGCGKSALMGRFSEEIMHEHPDVLIIPHFVGASSGSTNLRQTLRRLSTHLNRIIGSPEEVPEDIKELIQIFPDLLKKAAQERRIFIILDAVNQFEKTDNAHAMRWLPQVLPGNVRFVVSTLAGETFDALVNHRLTPKVEDVTGLDESEIRELVADYLKEIRHEFPNKQVENAFFHKVKAGNPLYIQVALEELRVFGLFEQLAERIGKLPDTVPALFDQVLERIESDFNPALVGDCMAYIACGRQGMTAEELQTLLCAHAPAADPSITPEKLPDMTWARLYRAFGAYLFEHSGVIDFFHGQLKETVGQRYLLQEADRLSAHRIIADYFENRWQEPYIRALDELPHQRIKVEDWNGLEKSLTDLFFIKAKCAAGMTYDLIADYSSAHNALPEAQAERETEIKHEQRVIKYIDDLIEYSKGEIKHLDIFPSVKPWNEEQIRPDTERIQNNPNRLDRIKAFSQFVNSESHNLVKFGYSAGFCIQQAYNSADSGPVRKEAEDILNSSATVRKRVARVVAVSKFNLHFPIIRTLEHVGGISDFSITPDMKIGIIGNITETALEIWDLQQTNRIQTIITHLICSLDITPDGEFAVSTGWETPTGYDKKEPDDLKILTFKVWDLQKGQCLNTIEIGFDACTTRITADGRRAVVVSENVFTIWDLNNSEPVIVEKIRHPYCYFILGGVSLTPDGKLIFLPYRSQYSGSMDVYNTERRVFDRFHIQKEIFSCYGDPNEFSFTSIALTPDASIAVTGESRIKDPAYYDTVKVWDIKSRRCIKKLKGHPDTVYDVSVTPDGKLAVSTGRDRCARLWDIQAGECIKILRGHSKDIGFVKITPDGTRAITASADGLIILWDLQKALSLQPPHGHTEQVNDLQISSKGKVAVSCSGMSWGDGVIKEKDCSVKVWDAINGKFIKTLSRGTVAIDKIWISSNEKVLVIRSYVGEMALGNIDDGSVFYEDVESTKEKFYSELNKWENEFSDRQKREWSDRQKKESSDRHSILSDGRFELSFWSKGDYVNGNYFSITLEDRKTSQPIKSLLGIFENLTEEGTTEGLCVRIAPDDKLVFFSGKDKILRMWDLCMELHVKEFEGHTGATEAIEISPTGKVAASVIDNHNIVLWDIKKGQSIHILEDHTDSIKFCRFTANGMTLISSSADQTVRLWDVNIGQCLAIIPNNSPITALAVKNNLIALGDMLGNVNFYSIEKIAKIDYAIADSVRMWKSNLNEWDDKITAKCGWCEARSPVPDHIIGIINEKKLPLDESPCIYLPDGAWDDPLLTSHCPQCGGKLRFNPFIVDNKLQYRKKLIIAHTGSLDTKYFV